jgi:hypothetical protein
MKWGTRILSLLGGLVAVAVRLDHRALTSLTFLSSTCKSLSAGALAVRAPWPATGPTLAFFKLLLGPANAAFSSFLLLGIFDPADELVAGQRRDVPPGGECGRAGDQTLTQVSWKLVHYPTGDTRATHRDTVATQTLRSTVRTGLRLSSWVFCLGTSTPASDGPCLVLGNPGSPAVTLRSSRRRPSACARPTGLRPQGALPFASGFRPWTRCPSCGDRISRRCS